MKNDQKLCVVVNKPKVVGRRPVKVVKTCPVKFILTIGPGGQVVLVSETIPYCQEKTA